MFYSRSLPNIKANIHKHIDTDRLTHKTTKAARHTDRGTWTSRQMHVDKQINGQNFFYRRAWHQLCDFN